MPGAHLRVSSMNRCPGRARRTTARSRPGEEGIGVSEMVSEMVFETVFEMVRMDHQHSSNARSVHHTRLYVKRT